MIYFQWVLIVLLSLVFVVLSAVQIGSLIALVRTRGVPFVPLWRYQLQKIQEHIHFDNPEDIRLVDLGSGDGRVLFLFEQLGVRDLTGYEINWWAIFNAWFFGYLKHSRAKFFNKNFNSISLERFNVAFCYLMPNVLNGLQEKFLRELPPGARIISYAFEITNWPGRSEVIYTAPGVNKERIFIYHLPEKT
jgi:hypothetical protein